MDKRITRYSFIFIFYSNNFNSSPIDKLFEYEKQIQAKTSKDQLKFSQMLDKSNDLLKQKEREIEDLDIELFCLKEQIDR